MTVWPLVLACRELWNNLTAMQFGWLVAGGLCYTVGVPFFLWKSRTYAHAVWHLFVVGGSVLQFLAVLYYVLPKAP